MAAAGAKRRASVALALSGIAGFVDAVGWLTLDHVFTAQMSGNTVLIGTHAAAGEGQAALLQAFTIAMFFVGLVASGIVMEAGKRRGFRHILAIAMAIEAVLLGLYAATADRLLPAAPGTAPDGALYFLVAVTAMAMGTQNTSLRMAGVLGVYTTHITGTITKLGEDLIAWSFAVVDRLAGRTAAAPRSEIGFTAGLWLCFLAGATVAALLLPVVGHGPALLLPIAVLLAILALDLRAPLAAKP